MQPSPSLTCELLEGKQGLSWKEVTYLCLREEEEQLHGKTSCFSPVLPGPLPFPLQPGS